MTQLPDSPLISAERHSPTAGSPTCESRKQWLYLSDQCIMRALLFGMALSIIAFNVMGYKELFNETGIFFGITPFGLLIGFAEIAVLFWTSSVIRNLPTASRALVYAVIPVILGFWFLCFTGINSYLTNSTYQDFTESQAAKSRYENNDALLTSLDTQIISLQATLGTARSERTLDSDRLLQLQEDANTLSDKMSQRRLGYAICDQNPDCAAAVAEFQQQSDNIQRQMDLLHTAIADKQKLISGYEAELSELNRERRELAKDNRDDINEYVQTESAFSVKKQTYENIVINVYEFLGLEKPADPFASFISFISFIIYPVYLILNLYTGLGSEANCAAREARKKIREQKAQRKAVIQTEIEDQRELIAKEKRTLAHQKALANIRSGTTKRRRIVSYLHSEKESTFAPEYTTTVHYYPQTNHYQTIERPQTPSQPEPEAVDVPQPQTKEAEDIIQAEPVTETATDLSSLTTTDRIKNTVTRWFAAARKPQ